MGGRLTFTVWDEDTLSDDKIGAFNLNSKDIIDGQNGKYFWKNIYGAPMGVKGKACDDMNDNPDNASFWKGRILMQVSAVKTERP